MRYEIIDNSLFINNRKNFLDKVDKNSASVFVSNEFMPTNAWRWDSITNKKLNKYGQNDYWRFCCMILKY